VSTSARTANHWIGTARMGTDSGLTGGTSVVDTSTKVYGTDNVSSATIYYSDAVHADSVYRSTSSMLRSFQA